MEWNYTYTELVILILPETIVQLSRYIIFSTVRIDSHVGEWKSFGLLFSS